MATSFLIDPRMFSPSHPTNCDSKGAWNTREENAYLIVSCSEMPFFETGRRKSAALEPVLLLTFHHGFEFAMVQRVHLNSACTTRVHANQSKSSAAWYPFDVVAVGWRCVRKDMKETHGMKKIFTSLETSKPLFRESSNCFASFLKRREVSTHGLSNHEKLWT